MTNEVMTLDEFLLEVPRAGWSLNDEGGICRPDGNDPDGHCLTSWVNYLRHQKSWSTPHVNLGGLRDVVWATADNKTSSPLFDPTLRVRLLEHCGLAEVAK